MNEPSPIDQPSFRDATGEETHFENVNDNPNFNGEPIYLHSSDEGDYICTAAMRATCQRVHLDALRESR